MDNLFYRVIGKHGGEKVVDIIDRKQDEITRAGFSIWSAKLIKSQ